MTLQGIEESEKIKNRFTMLKEFITGLSDSESETKQQTNNLDLLAYQQEEIIDMPGIRKNKKGLYEVRIQKNKKRISKYAKSLKEAKKILSQLKRNEFLEAQTEINKTKIYTIQEWFNEWLITYKKPIVSETTLQMIKGALNKILPYFKNTPITKLNAIDIQKELNKMEHNRTKERICIYFNAMLQKAEDLNIIEKNPFKAVTKEQRKKFKNNAFTFEEQCTILKIVKNTDIEYEIMTYLMTGCRPSELPKNNNFDFINKTVTIYGTKNENAKERIIEMSDAFSLYMEKYLKNHKLKESSYVSKAFIEICKKEKINKPILYKLRHCFATNHFTLGTPVKYVQCWMGHSSIQMTMDIYTDIDKTSSKEKIKKLYNNFYYEIKQ